MLQLNHPVTIQPQLSSLISKEELKATAEQYKNTPVPHITDEICSRSREPFMTSIPKGTTGGPIHKCLTGFPTFEGMVRQIRKTSQAID